MPGVVSHATNLVEHPQLVADRAQRGRSEGLVQERGIALAPRTDPDVPN